MVVTPVIPTLEKWRQEGQFKVTLDTYQIQGQHTQAVFCRWEYSKGYARWTTLFFFHSSLTGYETGSGK